MRPSAIAFGAALLGLVAMPSCATSSREKDKEKILQARWTTKKYEVSFTSGPDAPGNQKTLSYYRVRPIGKPGEEIIIPSAQTTNGLRSVTDSNPKRHIRLIEDPKNAVLLIEETVINDCCPCMNYALIEPSPDYGYLRQYKFLQFASRPTGRSEGAFGSDFPSVTAINGGIIEYKYGDGPIEQSDIKSLPSTEEPTPAG
ncbi:MAG: hypothetical protein V4726_21610 [Verrucomicrobiota bacterium]